MSYCSLKCVLFISILTKTVIVTESWRKEGLYMMVERRFANIYIYIPNIDLSAGPIEQHEG